MLAGISGRTLRALYSVLSVLVVVLGSVGQADAAVDYQFLLSAPSGPTAVTSSTQLPDQFAVSTANNTGMSGVSYPSDTHDTDPAHMWSTTPNDPSPYIQYNLGHVYPIGKMLIWNYAAYIPGYLSFSGRGVKDCKIWYSKNGTTWTQLQGPGSGGAFTLAQASTANVRGPAGTVIDFKGVPASHVKIQPISNWGGHALDTATYYGLSAVRIYRYATNITYLGQFIAARTLATSSAYSDMVANNQGMSDAGIEPYTTGASVGTATYWSTDANDAVPYIMFDLGGVYPIGWMMVWNLNFKLSTTNYSGRGIKNAKIYYTTEDPYRPFSNWTLLMNGASQTWQVAKAPGTGPSLANAGIFLNSARARFVAIVPELGNNNGNWGGLQPNDGSNAYYGLSQVRFFTAAGLVGEPVPYWSNMFAQRSTTVGWAGSDNVRSISYLANGQQRSLFTSLDVSFASWDPTTYHQENVSMITGSYGIYSGGKTLTPALSGVAIDVSHHPAPPAPPPPTNIAFYWLMGGLYTGSGSNQKISIAAKHNWYYPGHEYHYDWAQLRGITMLSYPVATNGTIQYGSLTQSNAPFGQFVRLDTFLTEVEVTNQGSGYTSPPTVTFSNTDGSGATAVATIASGKVTAVTVTYGGTGYYHPPNVTLSGGGGSGAQAVVNLPNTTTVLGVSMLTVGSDIYVYGYRGNGFTFLKEKYAIVAKTTAANLTNYSQWKLWNGSAWVNWTDIQTANPARISPDGTGELFSVTPAFDAAHSGQYMLTAIDNIFNGVHIAYAPNPWGPFGNNTTWTNVYWPSEALDSVQGDPQAFGNHVGCYAGFHHLELSNPGEALINYSCYPFDNSQPWISHSGIYTPRFVRLRTL
jgi:hypothetical protein